MANGVPSNRAVTPGCVVNGAIDPLGKTAPTEISSLSGLTNLDGILSPVNSWYCLSFAAGQPELPADTVIMTPLSLQKV